MRSAANVWMWKSQTLDGLYDGQDLDGEAMDGDIDGDAHGECRRGGCLSIAVGRYMARSWLQKSPMYILRCNLQEMTAQTKGGAQAKRCRNTLAA